MVAVVVVVVIVVAVVVTVDVTTSTRYCVASPRSACTFYSLAYSSYYYHHYQALGLVYTCIEGWLRVMYAAANGLTVEAVAARTDTLHLTLEQVSHETRGKCGGSQRAFLLTYRLTSTDWLTYYA